MFDTPGGDGRPRRVVAEDAMAEVENITQDVLLDVIKMHGVMVGGTIWQGVFAPENGYWFGDAPYRP